MILVALDESIHSSAVLQLACQVCHRDRDTIMLCSVIPMPKAQATADQQMIERAQEALSKGHFTKFRHEAATMGVRQCKTRLLHGPVKEALLQECRRIRPMLLVIGRRRHENVLGLGSVAASLVHDAPCPVLVARHTQTTLLRGIVQNP